MKFTKYSSSFLIIISLFLTSCSPSDLYTGQLWRNKMERDTLDQFLVAQNGKVALIGRKYHYIFDDKSGVIKDLLAWSGKSKLEIIIHKIKVDSSYKISGDVTINVKKTDNSSGKENAVILTKDELNFLGSLGFADHLDGNNVSIIKKIILKGTLYLSNPNVDYRTTSKLSKNYNIMIEFEPGLFKRTTQITMTPITVTADAIFIGSALILAIPLGILICVAMETKSIIMQK